MSYLRETSNVFLLCFAATIFFAVRLPMGVDLTDESFYITPVVDWIHNGFRDSNSLNINQLSELFVYPIARLYIAIFGGDGVVLFLRVVYAGMALTASIALYCFVRRFRPPIVALMCAALTITYIPFSLPAPSYNTVAMLGLLGAILLYGKAILNFASGPFRGLRPSSVLANLAGSAALWTIVIVAYPTLVVALGFHFIVGFMAARNRNEIYFVAAYVAVCAGAAAVFAGTLVALFGMERLEAMFTFTAQSAQLLESFNQKLEKVIVLYKTRPLVGGAVLAMTTVGTILLSLRCRRSQLWLCVAFALLCGVTAADESAAAFLKSHDLMNLGIIFALFLCAGTNWFIFEERTIAVLIAVSLFAGIITGATSGGSINNISIGGFAAVALALALAVPRFSKASLVMQTACAIPLIVILAGTAYSSQTYFYQGMPSGARPSRTLLTGPFLGLTATPEMARYIEEVGAAFDRHRRSGGTLTLFGRFVGIYLIANYNQHTLTAWPLGSSHGVSARRASEDFLKSRPPDFIALSSDTWTEPLGQAELLLLQRYKQVERLDVGSKHFELHELTR